MKTGMPLVGLATHTHKPSCCLNQELKKKKKKVGNSGGKSPHFIIQDCAKSR